MLLFFFSKIEVEVLKIAINLVHFCNALKVYLFFEKGVFKFLSAQGFLLVQLVIMRVCLDDVLELDFSTCTHLF